MTPRRKTSGILALAGGVIVAALLFTHASPRRRAQPLGGNSASAAGLGLSARMVSTRVLLGDHETHLAVTIQAPDDQGRRPPLHLAIAIDRSQSMNDDDGAKMEYARRAAIQLVAQLRPEDHVTIIGYDDRAGIVFDGAFGDERGKREAIDAVERLRAYGNTNISEGLELSAAQLRRFARAPGAVSRIILISDGRPTQGIIYREGLADLAAQTAASGISISTLGVGLDFNEHVMTDLAVSGRGNYYFVDAPEKLPEMIAQELGHIGATAATEVQVAIAPAAGVHILDAYGYPARADGGRVLIPVADLRAGEQRKIVLRMRVDAGREGVMEIGRIETSFLHVASGRRATAELITRAVVTADAGLVARSRDREAVRHIERALTANAIGAANQLYESGQYQAAQQLLEGRAQEVRGTAAEMGYADLDKELNETIGRAGGNFAAAPAAPGSDPGKRGIKGNSADAYELHSR